MVQKFDGRKTDKWPVIDYFFSKCSCIYIFPMKANINFLKFYSPKSMINLFINISPTKRLHHTVITNLCTTHIASVTCSEYINYLGKQLELESTILQDKMYNY